MAANAEIVKLNRENRVGLVFKCSKYGVYEIVEYVSAKKVKVVFKNTGGVLWTSYSHVRDRNVKDCQAPTVYGVGVTGGEGVYTEKRSKDSYSSWKRMIERCYSRKRLEAQPSYIGCHVCDEWLYYPNFKKWFDLNHIKGWHLDKDTRVEGSRIYSPETCSFITPKENILHAQLPKMYATELISPSGNKVKVFNQREFCRDNGLHSSGLSKLISGKQSSCKGWKLSK